MTGIRRHFRRENGLTLLLLGIFSVLWLHPMLPDLDGPIFWVGGGFSDLLISHVPNSLYLNRMMATTSQIPLWNSSILSGIPFAADPLSGLHYPPIWLTQFVNPIIAFNILFVAHLFWLGAGGWILSREEGLSGVAGLLVGILLSGHPKLIGHIGLGHVSLVFAVSWTPWLSIAVGRALRYQEPTRRKVK